MIIKIKDISMFRDFIDIVSKFSQMVKFELSTEDCLISLKNENNTLMSIFKTNVLVSSEPVSFCLGELSKFGKCLDIFQQHWTLSYADLNFDNTYLSIDHNSLGFKYKIDDEKAIRAFGILSDKKENTYKKFWGMTLTGQNIKEIIQLSFITEASTESPKVYLYKSNDSIVADVDRKDMRMPSNSLKIPITKIYEGDWNVPVLVNMDMVRHWGLLKCDTLNIEITEQKILSVKTLTYNSDNKDLFIKCDLIMSTLRK